MENKDKKGPLFDPPDANPKGSKNPAECGDNGNPAQSAGRVSSQEQDAHPVPLEDPIENYPDLMPDSLSKTRGKP